MNWPPTYLQWFLIVGLPLMGLVYAFLGGIKLGLAERLQLDEGKVGGLVAGFGMMVGPTILACGFLTDAVGRRDAAEGEDAYDLDLVHGAASAAARGREPRQARARPENLPPRELRHDRTPN